MPLYFNLRIYFGQRRIAALVENRHRGVCRMKNILYVILEQWADWELAYISSAVNMLGHEKF